ncbi:PIN domain-containing protein [Paucibacter sp. JuS9]|uniref:PIN domain-containing protein n=1 Tax=Paucibacter sp. JuS9 TaxID=3228748 RepID=UPI003758169E
MPIFHVILDTSVLRPAQFPSSLFDRLLRRVNQGTMKLYIPEVVLEERRTQMLYEFNAHAEQARGALLKMAESPLSMLLQGIPIPTSVDLPTREDVDRNSRAVFRKYLEDRKVEILPFTPEHARQAFERYMHGMPPFRPASDREPERKHIPDSWIFEAALDLKVRPGRHCVLVKDARFEQALQDAGFEVFKRIDLLDQAIEEATAVVPIRPAGPAVDPGTASPTEGELEPALSTLDRLRADSFKNFDVVLIGMNEALNNPDKEKLFSTLESLEVDRAKAELMANTLVAWGVFREVGNRLLPTNVQLAQSMAAEPAVRALLMRLI